MKYQSKRRQRDRIRQGELDRTLASVKPNVKTSPECLVKPEPDSVQPKLPWYAGASDHFGEVRSRYYADQFFSERI